MSEPVAYVNNMCNDSIDWKVDPIEIAEGTPLYTHPAKTLTDEEIEKVFEETIRQPNFMMLGDTQRFARAILRKAQEK